MKAKLLKRLRREAINEFWQYSGVLDDDYKTCIRNEILRRVAELKRKRK